jgi:hypothetical protein
MSRQSNLVTLSSNFEPEFLSDNILVNGRIIGELITIPRRYIPLSRQFPAVSLTRIATHLDLQAVDAPDFHDIMRSDFIEVVDDSEAFHDEFGVDDVTGNDITLEDNVENNRILSDLYEDALVHGGGQETPSYTDWMPLTGSDGNDYPIVAINTSTRVITVTGDPPALTYVKFSQYRVSGNSNVVRVYSQRGRELTASEAGIGLASGLRRRDQMQGHFHNLVAVVSAPGFAGGSGDVALTNTAGVSVNNRVVDLIADATNGTPRTGTTTRGPQFGIEVYQWLGRYLGA